MVAITSSSNGSHEECSPIILSPEEHETSNCPLPRKTLRKQWSVQGEPRQLLKKLRNQLAEDGCPESQYFMAKALLEHTEDSNYEEHCHQAIFWLTQASLQGYVEATELLNQCLEKGLGICEQNYQDVKRCLEMDHQEKLALVAGKQLFSCLAEGNEFVSQRKLEVKISEILNSGKETSDESEERKGRQMSKREVEKYLEEKYGSPRLTENLIVEAALGIVKGEVPSVNIKESFIFGEKQNVYDAFISMHLFTLGFIEHHLYYKFNLLLHSPLHFYLGLLFCFALTFFLFSWNQIAVAALIALWLICFFIMSSSAISILIPYRNKKLFNIWATVFQHFSQDLNLTLAYSKYKSKFIHSYFTYFSCMLAYLVLLPIINSGVKALITPPFILVSCCILTSLFQTNLIFNCMSSLFYVFAHYSDGHLYLKDWFIHIIPSLRPYIIKESFSVQNLLYFNLDIGSIFHSLWFVSLAFVSATLGVSGILVHILCVTWFHMTLLASGEFSGAWIYFSIFAWSMILFLPKGIRLMSFIAPSLLMALCFLANDFSLWIACSSFTVCVVLLYISSRVNPNLGALLKFLFFMLSSLFLLQEHTEAATKISSLKWDQFQNICLPARETFGIHTMLECHPLRGTTVQWQASVKQVEIESVHNLPETLSTFFPPLIRRRIECVLGRSAPFCEDRYFNSETDRQRCLLVREVTGAECSLEEWNEYRFRFIVSMESTFWKFSKSSDVVLLAGNEFRSVAFNLSAHDRISFIGTLEEGLGTSQPVISLISLSCVDCQVRNLSASSKFEMIVDYQIFSKSLKSTFNFFFGPTITV